MGTSIGTQVSTQVRIQVWVPGYQSYRYDTKIGPGTGTDWYLSRVYYNSVCYDFAAMLNIAVMLNIVV